MLSRRSSCFTLALFYSIVSTLGTVDLKEKIFEIFHTENMEYNIMSIFTYYPYLRAIHIFAKLASDLFRNWDNRFSRNSLHHSQHYPIPLLILEVTTILRLSGSFLFMLSCFYFIDMCPETMYGICFKILRKLYHTDHIILQLMFSSQPCLCSCGSYLVSQSMNHHCLSIALLRDT